MKNIQLFLAFIAILAFSACQQQTKSNESESSMNDEATLVTYKMDVKGMTCSGCENTVKKSASEVEGVAEVTASHTDSTATVRFDASKTNINTISQAIQKKGYTVAGSEKIGSE